MIRNDKTIVVERSGEFDESSFGIDTEDVSLILEIIRNKLYSNKVGSFVREITSNAYDAMVEAAINRGETELAVRDQTIEFTLPSRDNNNTFTIRDYGTGMSDEKVKKIYTRVGKSTRSGSNKFVGMMGIGRLVGFCMTDSFNVASYVDGIRTEYLCYIDETKCGKVAMLSQTETTEPNGIAISVNVPEEFWDQLAQEVTYFTSFIEEVKFRFLSTGYDYRFSRIDRTKEKDISFKGTGWVRYSSFIGESRAYVKMGLVKYPLPNSMLHGEFFRHGTTIFTVPIGDVTVGASREGLEFTAATKAYVEKLIENAKEEAAKEMMADVAKAKDVREAVIAFNKHHDIWASLDRPTVKYTNPINSVEIDLKTAYSKMYEMCTFRLSMVDKKGADGKVELDANKHIVQIPELDANGKPITLEQKNKADRYEARVYKLEWNRRTKKDRTFDFNWENLDKMYFRIVDDHDVESLPDIRRCRTLFNTNSTHLVYVFTKRGLEHFIAMNGFDPTPYMKKFEDVQETILPRGTASRPPVLIKSVVFEYDPVTKKVKAESSTNTVDLDNLAPGYWVSRHYSSILYNRSEMRAIDENELYQLFTCITAFLQKNTTLYILPANCGRILDNLRKEGSDEYADLIPVYAWVDKLFKETTLLEHLCNATTDIHLASWQLDRATKIFKRDFDVKSKKTVEVLDLIKKAIRPLVPGEVNVPGEVIEKLRQLHNTDTLKVRNYSEMLAAKSQELHKRFPLMPEQLCHFDHIEAYVHKLPVYDEYLHAVEYHRDAAKAASIPQLQQNG
jgi:hypothetical protein